MRLEVHAIALCSSAGVLSVYFLSNSDTYITHTHTHTNTPHTQTLTHTNTLYHFSGFSFGFCINREDSYLLPTIARKITCWRFD